MIMCDFSNFIASVQNVVYYYNIMRQCRLRYVCNISCIIVLFSTQSSLTDTDHHLI